MSDGDEASDDAAADESDAQADPEDLDAETLADRLDEVASALEAADTEGDLDDVEADLDAIAEDVGAADLPEPDEDDEDADDPKSELEDRIGSLREDLEAARGPYAEDVVSSIEDAQSTIRDTRWTEAGLKDIQTAVETFFAAVTETIDTELTAPAGDPDELADGLDPVVTAIEEADLDPDADAETIDSLIAASEELDDGLDGAEEWDDLDVRGQLRAEGFYEALGHKHKDFPPEWSALKEWESRGNAEMILLAYEQFDSDFMERHCLEALERMGHPAAVEPMLEQAERRDKDAIRILGAVGEPQDEVIDTLVEYLGTDSDPDLERVTMRALGEIGATDAVQEIAHRLVADNETVRSAAARSLGLIGDPRAIAPLDMVLTEDDVDSVRASAAWALRQIGTEAALSTASEYTDDNAYVVQTEAEAAAEALDEPTAAPA